MSVRTTRGMSRRRGTATGLFLVAALVAASCASDDDSSAETVSGDAETPVTTEAAEAAESETETEPSETAETDESESTEGGLWTAAEPNMDPVDDATAAEWQQLTEEALAASVGTPGVLIAVSHPELGYWSAAIGDAEVDADPMTLDHHSRIGSVTKTMTAVAILQLVDAGSLSLDDTVAGIVPDVAEEFPPTADITVEQLLSMTSGLPDYANLPGGATAQAVQDPTKVWTPEELIAAALGAAEVQPIGTPGYSTTNFTILGLMYEEVTGDTIENGVTRVAEEAGLTETALLPGDQNAMPDPSTHGYVDPAGAADLQQLANVEVEPGTDATDWSLSWGGAGGGAYSTIADLFQWAATGSGNTLLSSELGEQRLPTEEGFIPDAGAFYGLGLLMQAPPWVGHSGQAIGWESYEVFDPTTGGTFAVLVNSTGGLSPFLNVWASIFELA